MLQVEDVFYNKDLCHSTDDARWMCENPNYDLEE